MSIAFQQNAFEIDAFQIIGWGLIPTTQNPSWTTIVDVQTPNWVIVNNTQTPITT
jgi:hypothetical protein